MPGHYSIAQAGQHIGDRISNINAHSNLLPGRLDHARDLAGEGAFAETNAAQREAADIAARATAQFTAVSDAHLEFAM